VSRYHEPSTWLDRVAVCFCLFATFILMQLTAWKENEYFWTMSGGYAIWLRELVYFIYYPYFLGTFICLLITSRFVLLKLYRKRMMNRCMLFLFLAWVVFGSSGALLVANNFLNLLEGRPLHYHAPMDQPYRPYEPGR